MLYDVIINEGNVFDDNTGHYSVGVNGIDEEELDIILTIFINKGRYDIIVRRHSENNAAVQITD